MFVIRKRALLCFAMLWIAFPQQGIGSVVATDQALFALVIGYNQTDDPSVGPLRYADDDAVQNALLLVQLGAQVVLLTTLDEASRSLYPNVEPQAPTRAAVHSAMTKLGRMARRAEAAGKKPSFYFFYSGHGDVEHNVGYVNLSGSRLNRDDLLTLVGRSQAQTNHLIIDACKSYFLVFERGPGGSRARTRGPFVDPDRRLPDNTGVFLSTSSAADSHEWEAYQGGIFSHELRSALRGSADINQDGGISYNEAAAFVWTANRSIPNARLRPSFYARAPVAAPSETDPLFIRLPAAGSDRLHLGAHFSRHVFVEDGNGTRIADLHPGGQLLVLLLPESRPLFLRDPRSGEEAEIRGESPIELSQLEWRPVRVARRGAEHLAFSKLFNVEFDEEACQEYMARKEELEATISGRRSLASVRRSLAITSGLFAFGGAVLTGMAHTESTTTNDLSSGVARLESNARLRRLEWRAAACYIAAGVLLTSYLTWTFWPEKEIDVNLFMYTTVAPGAGAMIRFDYE